MRRAFETDMVREKDVVASCHFTCASTHLNVDPFCHAVCVLIVPSFIGGRRVTGGMAGLSTL